jgi:hypothetical protein
MRVPDTYRTILILQYMIWSGSCSLGARNSVVVVVVVVATTGVYHCLLVDNHKSSTLQLVSKQPNLQLAVALHRLEYNTALHE